LQKYESLTPVADLNSRRLIMPPWQMLVYAYHSSPQVQTLLRTSCQHVFYSQGNDMSSTENRTEQTTSFLSVFTM
jgi:hypothetical protein